MTAGIISYYLCDLDFDCENCQLDWAMRKAGPNREQPSSGQSVEVQSPGLRAGLLYGRNHCWLKPLGVRLVRIGLEPGLSGALPALKAVVLPSPGETLRKGQSCLWIVLECGTFAIGAPCDGIVCGRNSRLGEQPHLLRFQPFDDGWLFDLEAEAPSPQDRDFMDAEKAETFYREDAARFKRSLGITSKANHLL
jgi:glycine cleavage system H protein